MAKKKNNPDKKPKAEKKEEKPKVHDKLKGFDMKINTFGEITSSFEVEKINSFLDEHVPDKKFTERDDSPFEEE
jgi:hypothetical protein